jgi:hypothetical protein
MLIQISKTCRIDWDKREQNFEECVHWVDQYASSNKTSDGGVPHIDVEDKV